MRFRSLAGLAAGALTAGVLAVPAAAVAADAPSASVQASFSCPYQAWTLDYTPTIEASYDGDDIKLDLGEFPGVAGPPAFVTVSKASATLTATIDGEDATFAGEHDIAPAVPLSGGFEMPDATAPVPAGFAGGAIEISGLEMSMTAMGSATAITCTMDETATIDMPAPPAPPSPVMCTYNDYVIGLDPTITAHGADGKVHVEMGTFPGIEGVPAFVQVKSIEATTTATYGGAEVALTGSSIVDPATPLADGFDVPTMSADRPAGVNGGELTMTAMSVDLVASAFGSDMPATIDCAMTEPMTVSVTAEEEPPAPAPVAKVKPKMQKVKANFKKKGKVLTVKAAVKGSKGVATGKVKITVKKGKKTVKKVTVKLNKKGAFTKKIKKIKGKGKFKVVIQYQGNKSYKKAKATKRFRA